MGPPMRRLIRRYVVPRVILWRRGNVSLGGWAAWAFTGSDYVHTEQLVEKLKHRVLRHGLVVDVTCHQYRGRLSRIDVRSVASLPDT